MTEFDKMADELYKIFNNPKKYKISEKQETALYYAIDALMEKYYDAKLREASNT